jgi:saccharopine dehydrogenase-like NADP-dependent oxidoreductase
VRYAELFGIRDSVQEMGRYTGRLPGHCAFWDIMVKSGFLDERLVRVGDESVSPLEFTASLLASQKQFAYADDEEDMTFLRVDARGIRRGKKIRVIYQMIDRRDFETGLTSMQRTVGFTMSLAARLILEGKLKPGFLTPLDVPYDHVIPALERHNIRVQRREIPWE